MKKTIMKIIYKCARIYWYFTRPITVGTRAILTNRKDEVLLVKHTYQSSWYLPGGKVARSENLIQALEREIHEELQLKIESPKLFGVYTNRYDFKHDHVIVYTAQCNDLLFDLKSLEIEEVRFFSLDDLPKNTSPGTRRRLIEYQNDCFGLSGTW